MDLVEKLVLAHPKCSHYFMSWRNRCPTLPQIDKFNLHIDRYAPKVNFNLNLFIVYDERLLVKNNFNIHLDIEDGYVNRITSDMVEQSPPEYWNDFNHENPVVPEFLNKILKITHGEDWNNKVTIELTRKITETKKSLLDLKTKL